MVRAALRARTARAVRSALRRRGFALVRIDDASYHWISRVDDRRGIPEALATELAQDEPPRLAALRARYAGMDEAITVHSWWRDRRVRGQIDLRYFRGDSPIMWHYLEDGRLTRFKYHTFLRHVAAVDETGLLGRLDEDGAFGCWTFEYPGWPMVSRDLLDSVLELEFLRRHVPAASRDGFRVLDIGAGYGRLAHRMASVTPGLVDYCCVDAIPEMTYLAEVYLDHRGVTPPARVVELPDVDDVVARDAFDLVVNIHSFSECTHDAVAWWARRLATLDADRLLIVPNEPTELLTREIDGSRRDFAPLIEQAGFALDVREPVISDPAVRDLLDVHDHFHLYRRVR